MPHNYLSNTQWYQTTIAADDNVFGVTDMTCFKKAQISSMLIFRIVFSTDPARYPS